MVSPLKAASDLQSLLDRSPFAPPKNEATGETPTEQGVLEFRGMVMEGTVATFSVFDASANKARWLKLGEGDSFKIKSFDSNSNQLEIEQQGKSLKLMLKRSTIQAGAAVVPAPQANGQPGGQPNARPGDPASDARRLETVAAEVRRRRALRSNPVPAQVPPPAAPNPTP